MYLIRLLIALLVAAAAPASAQQQSDAAFLQRAITAVQTQRNLALDAAAIAEARAATLTEDLARAQARIKALEPQPEQDKDTKP